eukprot:3789297-Rhodomonas_salina.4
MLGQMTGAATQWSGAEADQGAASVLCAGYAISGTDVVDGATRTGPMALRYGGAVEALCQRTSESECVVVMLCVAREPPRPFCSLSESLGCDLALPAHWALRGLCAGFALALRKPALTLCGG